jgi:TonB family protein
MLATIPNRIAASRAFISRDFRVAVLIFGFGSSTLFAQETNKEAEQVPVNTFVLQILTPPAGPDVKAFLSDSSQNIRRNWSVKFQDLGYHREKGIAVIRFTIDRSGALTDKPIVEGSSGSASLDDVSISTIKASEPFGQLPLSFDRDTLDVRCTFRYGVLPDGPYKSLYESAQRATANREFAVASQLLETLLSKDPDYTNAWSYLGWVYYQLGRYDKSVVALQHAITANPVDAYATPTWAIRWKRRRNIRKPAVSETD